MVHWSRFPAFRNVKNDLQKPHLTLSDRDRGAVFMRWKERFLVPDHRVQDISGASFAGSFSHSRGHNITQHADPFLITGFYYVCVDFNPPPVSTARSAIQAPLALEDNNYPSSLPSASLLSSSKPDNTQRIRQESSARRSGRSPSLGPRTSPPVASMSGFYFHQNSEP
jgi:hypothetical protein